MISWWPVFKFNSDEGRGHWAGEYHSNYEEALNKIIEDLPNGHHLITDDTIWVATHLTTMILSLKSYAQYVYSLAKQYDFIAVADWIRFLKANLKSGKADYIHFGGKNDTTIQGGTLYTQAIQDALAMAKDMPVKTLSNQMQPLSNNGGNYYIRIGRDDVSSF